MRRRVLEGLATAWPWAVSPDPSLDRSLAFLGWSVGADQLLAASYTLAAAIVTMLPLAMLLVPAGSESLAVIMLLALAVGVIFAARDGPQFLARVRRTRALGDAPTLLTYATVRMRLAPVPERAARFAGTAVDSPLGESLSGHANRSRGTPKTGFDGFAREWSEWFPAVERGCSLLESAGTASEDRRAALLDRARSAVLAGTRDRMASFASSVRGPATGIYAFGVFLPLALVSLLPALRAAGISTPITVLVALYNVVLPAVLIGATAWLLARRPMAFPPPDVDRSHPDVPETALVPLGAGLLVGVGAWIVASRMLLPWTAPVAALGAGVGTSLCLAYRPMVAVRREIESVEDGLGDALAMIGRQVAGGRAVEMAIDTVAQENDGATADVLATAAGHQRRLGVDLERALLGADGVLKDLPSDRLRGAGAMLAMAAREGAPAGDAMVSLSSHFDELDALERETRRSVESVTSTLSNTAAVFGPLVGGVTVALASAMGGPGPFAGAGDVSGLGLVVGLYVLALAVILTVLTTGLSQGLDRALAGYRSGIALLAATATYLTAVFVGTLVV